MTTIIKAFDLEKSNFPISIAEMQTVSKILDEVLNEDERKQLIDTLAFHPECGEPLSGSSLRLRKFKFGYGPKNGKSVLRVIYFFYDLNMPLYVLAVYKRGEILRPTKTEENHMNILTQNIIDIHASKTIFEIKKQNLSA